MDKENVVQYTMEYCSTIKKNGFESVVVRWMTLEPIIQSEICHKVENKIVYNVYIWNLEKIIQMNLLAGKKRRHRCIEETCGHTEGRRRWEELRK